MESTRQHKYARLIQREIGEILQKEAKHIIGQAFMTITSVKVSPDLSFAKVFVSILQKQQRQAQFELLEDHKSEFRKYLGNRIGKQVRVVPDLAFFLDETEDEAARIENILANLDIPPEDKED